MMQINPVDTNISTTTVKPSFHTPIAFRGTRQTADTFEYQNSKKETKKKTNLINIIGGALILGLSAALLYKHKNFKDMKSQVEALEKTKTDLEAAKKDLQNAKSALESSLEKTKSESSKKTKELDDKIKTLEEKINKLEQEKASSTTSPKAVEKNNNTNGQTVGGVDDQTVGGANGQAVGSGDGQAVSGANGQAVGSGDGQAVGGANGQAVGGANGQTNVIPNGQSDEEKFNQFLNQIIIDSALTKLSTGKKGLASIIGFDNFKRFVLEKVIDPIQKGVDIPNFVLLYGPQGCGKTSMGLAIAEAADCNTKKIVSCLNFENDFETLQKAIKNAEENYKKTGKHTIIRLEEVDGFLKEADSKTKVLFNNLAKEHHCTIVATTNFPNKINPNLIPDIGYQKYLLEPATEKDMEEILKYYLTIFSEESVNYSDIVKILKSNSDGNYYSNARLVSKAREFIKCNAKVDKKFTQEEIKEFFNEIKFDITKENVEMYKK